MEVTIECRWTKEDIEEMLTRMMESEGLELLPQPKRKDTDPDKMFVWPKGGKVKVRAQAVISSKPALTHKRMGTASSTLDASLLPDGANVQAIQAIERAAAEEEDYEEDPLVSAAKKRPLAPGESRERDG